MDTIKFGKYPQGSNEEIEEIEWLVLDTSNNESLLLSKYALDCKPYNTQFEETCGKDCSLRKWLNKDFFDTAFSKEEQEKIIISKVEAHANPDYPTEQGENTEDKVFLLSVNESKKYFKSDNERICGPTKYANKIGVGKGDETGACDNWLRTLGGSKFGACDVIIFGTIRTPGASVRGVSSGVRPALKLKI